METVDFKMVGMRLLAGLISCTNAGSDKSLTEPTEVVPGQVSKVLLRVHFAARWLTVSVEFYCASSGQVRSGSHPKGPSGHGC